MGDADDDGLDEVLIGDSIELRVRTRGRRGAARERSSSGEAPSGVLESGRDGGYHGKDRNGDYFGACTAIVGDVSGDGGPTVQLAVWR
ncbi:MAG: hypothetical protein R2724_35165 [Bryobacterales bacterium]